MNTVENRSETFARPAASFARDGSLEVRGSAAAGCRRALWYAATGREATNPPDDASLTMLDAGIALEPVVLHAMVRAGWRVDAPDPADPLRASVDAAPGVRVVGHPDAVARMPPEGGTPAAAEMFLFEEEPTAAAHTDAMVVEVKTRGPEAFRRWRTLGAERSHPESVAQAALYTHGVFGETRDAAIATLDTGSRRWDFEVVPADRVARAFDAVRVRLAELGRHASLHGPDPDALPDRDHAPGDWRCRSCPWLSACSPGAVVATDDESCSPVTDEDAREAVRTYTEAQAASKAPGKSKRAALDTLKAWMRGRDDPKATLGVRTVSLVRTKRYSVNHRKLNSLLPPEVRAGIVTESVSEHVRVS